MVISQIETMFTSGTKISVSVFDLNVIKITTTRRHNFGQSEQLSRLKSRSPGCLSDVVFVSFPQKRNGNVFSSGVNYLHSD